MVPLMNHHNVDTVAHSPITCQDQSDKCSRTDQLSHVRAFTLIEMMVVMAVIMILVGLTAAAAMGHASGSHASGTRSLVSLVELNIVDKGTPTLRLPSGVQLSRWDANNDGILDGRINPVVAQSTSHVPTPADPGIDPAISSADQETFYNLGHRGADALAMPLDPETFVNPLNGRILDSYGNELLIVFGEAYGPNGFGIISPGPDFQTDPDVLDPAKRTYDPTKPECQDDIVSWEHQ